MPADGAETDVLTPDPGPRLHGIAPVLVAEGEDVDEVVRTARAGVAVLSLHLRNAQHEATLAAGESSGWDLQAAKRFLTSTVELHARARRIEMAQELEQARTDAARLVLATRSDAAARIESAGEQALDVLLAGTVPASPLAAPSLRVVTEHPLEPAVQVAPAPPTPAPAPPTPETAPVGNPDPAPVVDEPAPLVDDPCWLPPEAAAVVAPAPVAAAAAPTPAPTPAPTQPATGSSRLSRFIYIDVLLPMVAVVIVLVVLLAWIG